jgi:hypothetical protein
VYHEAACLKARKEGPTAQGYPRPGSPALQSGAALHRQHRTLQPILCLMHICHMCMGSTTRRQPDTSLGSLWTG